MKVVLADWQEILLQEEQELNKRLQDLMGFMNSVFYVPLSDEQKALFERQQKAMTEYILVLAERISLF